MQIHMYMDFPVDTYCERTTSGYWAEPVNALSNIAFMVAGVLVWRMTREEAGKPASIRFMAPLMFLIGVGSFIFHTIATAWAQVLDIAPIAFFVIFYFGSFLRWFYQLKPMQCTAAVCLFCAVTLSFVVWLNKFVPGQSGPYLPILALLIAITMTLRSTRNEDIRVFWRAFAASSIIFTVALIARTADKIVCESFPLGTHFIWHVLDAALLYTVARPLIRRWHSTSEGVLSEQGALKNSRLS